MSEHTKTTAKLTNNIPDDCVDLISEKGYAILKDNNMILDVEPSRFAMRLHNGNFAAVYDQVRLLDEKRSRGGIGGYTNIRANEFGETLDETAAAVLTRLGYDPKTVHYWAVYLHELDEPNEAECTKVFTNNPNDFKEGSGVFAGFGYSELEQAKKYELELGDWKEKAEADLLLALTAITYWINNKVMFMKLRDADNGLLIGEYEAIKTKKGGFEHRLLRSGNDYAKRYYESADRDRRIAELEVGSHVIPVPYQGMLSPVTAAALAERGIIIKIDTSPRECRIAHTFDKFFSVPEYCAFKPHRTYKDTSGYTDVISNEDFGSSVDDTAANLIKRMGVNPSEVSYWAVYLYETDQPQKWGHTKIYTTDASELPESGGHLAGIAIKYNHDLTPLEGDSNAHVELRRAKKVAALDAMSEEEKAEALEAWRDDTLSRLKASLEDAEIHLNGKLFWVEFCEAKYGDRIYGVCDYDHYVAGDYEGLNSRIMAAIESFDKLGEAVDAEVEAKYKKPTAA